MGKIEILRADALWLVPCVLLGLPLALGGAHAATNIVAVTILAVAFILLLDMENFQLPLMGLAVLLALVFTMLQLLPLPVQLFAELSPGTFETWTLGALEDSAWRPLTMNGAATAHEVIKLGIAFFGIALGANWRHLGSRSRILMWVALAGGGTVLVTILHHALGWDRPWGYFSSSSRLLVSTFINKNHMAGFSGLCAFVALAWSFTTEGWRQVIAALIACGCAVSVAISLSRGGVLAFGLAALFLLILLLFPSTQGGHRRQGVLWSLVLVIISVVISVGFMSAVVENFEPRNEIGKWQIWMPIPSILGKFFFLGIGRGAFADVYTRFMGAGTQLTYTHLENEWLQIFVDWGPVLGAILLLITLYAFARLVRASWQDPASLAVVSGLAFVGLHNFVDFNLTLSAIILPVCLLWGAYEPPLPFFQKLSVPLKIIVIGLPVACVLWVIPSAVENRESARRAAVAAMNAGDMQKFQQIARRHPSDYVFALTVAQALPPNQGLKWVNRAMALAPRAGETHRIAGNLLAQLRLHEQAMLEYRLACEAVPEQTGSIATQVLKMYNKAEVLTRLIAANDAVRDELGAYFLGISRPDLTVQTFQRAGEPTQLKGRRAMAEAEARLGLSDSAEERARNIITDYPQKPESYILLARILQRKNEADNALSTLETGLLILPGAISILQERAVLLRDLDRFEAALRATHTLRNHAPDINVLARAEGLLGQIFAEMGSTKRAREHYSIALNLQPWNTAYQRALKDLK